MLPEFDLYRPRTLPEALALLDSHSAAGPGAKAIARPIAGGTNVIVELRGSSGAAQSTAPGVLVDISRLPELKGIRREGDRIVVGGSTTISELMDVPLIAEHGTPLRQAAAAHGNPLVRNRATLGGNLVDASPAADTAPALMVLGAEVELISHRDGRRCMPVEAFITGPNCTELRPGELLLSVSWPVPPATSRAAFNKLGLRRAAACAVINAAVWVDFDEEGRCRSARIGLGAVAPRPMRATAAEAALAGKRIDGEVVAEVAALAAAATSPIDDIRATAAYRRRVTGVVVARLLSGLAHGGRL